MELFLKLHVLFPIQRVPIKLHIRCPSCSKGREAIGSGLPVSFIGPPHVFTAKCSVNQLINNSCWKFQWESDKGAAVGSRTHLPQGSDGALQSSAGKCLILSLKTMSPGLPTFWIMFHSSTTAHPRNVVWRCHWPSMCTMLTLPSPCTTAGTEFRKWAVSAGARWFSNIYANSDEENFLCFLQLNLNSVTWRKSGVNATAVMMTGSHRTRSFLTAEKR